MSLLRATSAAARPSGLETVSVGTDSNKATAQAVGPIAVYISAEFPEALLPGGLGPTSAHLDDDKAESNGDDRAHERPTHLSENTHVRCTTQRAMLQANYHQAARSARPTVNCLCQGGGLSKDQSSCTGGAEHSEGASFSVASLGSGSAGRGSGEGSLGSGAAESSSTAGAATGRLRDSALRSRPA